MSGRSLTLSAIGLSLSLGAASISAHHSFAAEYDANRPLTVTGTVVRLGMDQPARRVFIDAKDEGDKVVHWDFELAPPNGLMRRDWNRNSLKPGHVVTVTGFHSKTEATVANARTVTLADGRQVFAGSSFETGTPDPAPPAP
jgi:hypothetical protein